MMSSNHRAAVAQCDRSTARKFLQLLGTGPFTFQTFDENAARKNPALARVFNGTFDQHLATLEGLNRKGGGIFVTINRTDGKGRRARNITGVRAVFVDLDGAPLAPVMASTLVPHTVVESSPDRFHAYWLVDETVSLSDFRGLQKKLAKLFNGDPTVHDLPRVLRLPGFLHRKKTPFRTRIMHLDTNLPRYSLSELSTALADVRVNDISRERGTPMRGLERRKSRKMKAATPAIKPDQPGNIKAAVQYLKTDAPPAVAFKRGNDCTYRTACIVRSCYGLSESTCYEIMFEHFNPRCNPPWSLAELHALVANAYLYGQGAVGEESAEAEFANDEIPPIPEIRVVRAARSPKPKIVHLRATLRRRRAMAFAKE
jgi:hypothetical protein